MSVIHNKYLNPLSNLLINNILARSAHQILSIKDDFTFLFLNFLKSGLCNCSANFLLEIFSLLAVQPYSCLFFSKNL